MATGLSKRSFTLEELQIAEKVYLAKRQVRVLIMGRWEYRDMTPGAGSDLQGTRAESVAYKDHHTFTEFLKERCKNGDRG